MRNLVLLTLAVCAAFPQSAQYPTSIATDSNLKVTKNGVSTTLRNRAAPGDTVISVYDCAAIVPNMLLTLARKEIVNVVSVGANCALTVGRGFDGTAAIWHASSAEVASYQTAWERNVLKKEIQAIETALGPNLSNLSSLETSYNAVKYDFPEQSPGGSLVGGIINSVTLTPVPAGVNATDVGHYLYISGGTGSAEAVVIQGGTAVAGASSGTVFLAPVNNHSGAWTVQSASDGIQEAVCALGANGGTAAVPAGSYTLRAAVGACGISNPVMVSKMEGATLAGSFTVMGSQPTGQANAEQFRPANTTNIAKWLLHDPGPESGSAGTAYRGLKVNIGNYPASHEYGTGILEGIVGQVDTSATSYNTTFTGVAGYARGNGQAYNNAVGVMGFGSAGAAGGGVWGANLIGHNTGGWLTPVWGAEVDVVTRVGASLANYGVQVVGDKAHQALGDDIGFGVSTLGSVKWKHGFVCAWGATETCVESGPTEPSGAAPSQPLKHVARDSGGNYLYVIQQQGQTGIFQTSLPSGGHFTVVDQVGTQYLDAGKQGIYATVKMTGSFLHLLNLSFAGLTGLTPPTGSVAYCTDCNTAVSPCTAGGTGATATFNGSVWKCGY